MIAPGRVAAILLAAGRSRRFGDADKLAAPLNGQPLGHHAAATLRRIPFRPHVVVTGPDAEAYAKLGFTAAINPHPEQGLASSIRCGVAAVAGGGAEAILIVLADMPFVTAAHILRLLDGYEDAGSIVASCGAAPCPPALFGKGWFPALQALEGDRGASALLARAALVAADARTLADVDTPADLAQLSRWGAECEPSR